MLFERWINCFLQLGKLHLYYIRNISLYDMYDIIFWTSILGPWNKQDYENGFNSLQILLNMAECSSVFLI